MEAYIKCISPIFKKDISELCDKCPLIYKIKNGIKKQIISQALEQKEILTNDQFQSYINSEVKNAKESMQVVHEIELQNSDYENDPYRVNRIEVLIWNKERIKALNSLLILPTPLEKVGLPQQEQTTKTDNLKPPEVKMPPEVLETVFSILKDFFDPEQQNEFKRLLETFGTTDNTLVFKSNQNQFADTFKKLFENSFILGWQKKDLIDWIALNFSYIYRNKINVFKKKTLEQIISGNQTPCKKPIIEVKNGIIQRIDH